MAERVETTALITAKSGQGALLKVALRELAQDTVKEPGCVVFRVFEAYSMPDRFVVWQIFKDEPAFRVHMESPHMRDFAERGLTAATEVVRIREL